MNKYLLLIAFSLAMLCNGSSAMASTDIVRHEVGKFTIISEHWVNDPGRALLHSPNETKVVRLTWQSEDGKIKAMLEDNGQKVTYSYTLIDNNNVICLSNQGLFAIGETPSDGKFWEYQSDHLDDVTKECGDWGEAEIMGYQAEMRASQSDAPRAFDLWKEQSAKFYASKRRCLKFEDISRVQDPFRFPPACVKISE